MFVWCPATDGSGEARPEQPDTNTNKNTNEKVPIFAYFSKKNRKNRNFPPPYPCLLLRETAAPTDNSRKMKIFRAKRKKHNDNQLGRQEGRKRSVGRVCWGRRRKFPISSDRKPFPLIFSFDPSLLLRRWRREDLLLRWEVTVKFSLARPFRPSVPGYYVHCTTHRFPN